MPAHIPTDPQPEGSAPTLADLRIAERRERVAMLLARRLTAREITKALVGTPLECSQRTVESDTAAIRAEMGRALAGSSVLDVAGDVMRQANVRERELWSLFGHAAGKTREKKVPRPDGSIGLEHEVVEPPDRLMQLRVLAELRASEREKLQALQSLGVVYKAPAKVAMDMRLLALLGELPADQLEALAGAKDDASLHALLVGAVGEQAASALLTEGGGPVPAPVPAPAPAPRTAPPPGPGVDPDDDP